jgi:hypothetical protein
MKSDSGTEMQTRSGVKLAGVASPRFTRKKKARQSVGRRVSFADPAQLESVREFIKEEEEREKSAESESMVPVGFAIEEASVEAVPVERTETFEFKPGEAATATAAAAAGGTPSPLEAQGEDDFSLSPAATPSEILNSEGKHTPGKRRSSIGRFGTPNSADRTGTFTFNASQNMDDVTGEVPSMGALAAGDEGEDTENITGAVPSLSNLLSADESPVGYRPTPTRAQRSAGAGDVTEDITGTVPSLAALAEEDEVVEAPTPGGEMDMDMGNTTDGLPAFDPMDDATQRAVDAAHASALDLANTVMMDDATLAMSVGAPTPSLTFGFDEKSQGGENAKRSSVGPNSVTANTRPFNLTDSTNLDLQRQAKGGMGTDTFNYVYGANGNTGGTTANVAAPQPDAEYATAEVTGTDVRAAVGVTPVNAGGVGRHAEHGRFHRELARRFHSW